MQKTSMTESDKEIAEIVAGAKPILPHRARPIVVVGAGGIVQSAHLPAYHKARFPVAALVDPQTEKAASLAREFGVEVATGSIAEAISKSPEDCVFDVAVPASAILSILPELPDGSAVLIQKPMGETLREAEAILELCRQKKLTAAINFQLRWAPVMLATRALADAGYLGELHDLEFRISVHTPWELWSFLSAAPRLEILYHSIHYIDLIRSWLGEPLSVYAKTVRSPITPNLAATKTVIVFDYGEWRRVFLGTNHSHGFGSELEASFAQWEGTKGAVRAQMGVNLNYPVGEADYAVFAPVGASWQKLPTEGNWFPDAFVGSMASLQAYVDGVTDQLPTSVEDAIGTMRLVEAAYVSSERGGVPLPSSSR
jgi:predicted dehydrogenase